MIKEEADELIATLVDLFPLNRKQTVVITRVVIQTIIDSEIDKDTILVKRLQEIKQLIQ